MRTTTPTKDNKYYLSTKNGGYSECIRPQDYNSLSYCNGSVLANCVGYVNSRWMELMGNNKYKKLHANAEKMVEKAKELGLEISPIPVEYGIMVWQKGLITTTKDGFGHVAIVEKVINDNCIFTSESDYGSTIFHNRIRYNTDKKWNASWGSKFIGCIKLPVEREEVLKFVTKTLGVNIRKTLSFNSKNVASGTKLGTVKKGDGDTKEKSPIVVKGFIDGIQKDGYQWVLVEYKGQAGYCQYDSKCYTIEEL